MSRHSDLEEVVQQIGDILNKTGLLLDETRILMLEHLSYDPEKLANFMKDPEFDKLSHAAFMSYYMPRLQLGKVSAEMIITSADDEAWTRVLGALYGMRAALTVQKTRTEVQLEAVQLVNDVLQNQNDENEGEEWKTKVDPFKAAKDRMRGDINPEELN